MSRSVARYRHNSPPLLTALLTSVPLKLGAGARRLSQRRRTTRPYWSPRIAAYRERPAIKQSCDPRCKVLPLTLNSRRAVGSDVGRMGGPGRWRGTLEAADHVAAPGPAAAPRSLDQARRKPVARPVPAAFPQRYRDVLAMYSQCAHDALTAYSGPLVSVRRQAARARCASRCIAPSTTPRTRRRRGLPPKCAYTLACVGASSIRDG